MRKNIKMATSIGVVILIFVTIGIVQQEPPQDGQTVAPYQDVTQIANTASTSLEQSASAGNNAAPSDESEKTPLETALDFSVLDWPASEYDAVFGQPDPWSPLQKVHARFASEARDESWANAMESGISQALVRSDVTAKITVAYVSCRSTICEVAGFMPDRMTNPDLDPNNLFPDDLGAGWWQGPAVFRKALFEPAFGGSQCL